MTHLIFALTLGTTLLTLAHYYLWRRLVHDPQLPSRTKAVLSVLLALLAVSQPVAFIVGRSLPRETALGFAFLAFGWMGMLSTLFVLLSGVDLTLFFARGVRWISARARSSSRPEPVEQTAKSPEKRAFLQRAIASGVAVGAGSWGAVAVNQALAAPSLKRVEVSLARLPAAFDGFTIVQMSDIHVGPTIGRAFIESIVEAANAQSPDLIALTGDLVDGSVAHLSRHTAPLAQLKAKHGVWFVTGNHEYYSGADEWISELQRLAIFTLRNASTRISRQGQSLLVAGVTDHRAGSYGDPPDFARALRDRKPDEEVVLLAHQPRAVAQAQKHDVGLQLSGHTHGGQFWPWNWVIHLIEPVVAGLARFGRTQIYVNSGTGYWGPPMRSGTRSEITVVTLRAEQAA